MIIKNLTGLKMEDEFIKVDGDESLVEVASKMLNVPYDDGGEMKNMRTLILAAYVMDGNKPVGVIDREDVIKASIIERKDPVVTQARDVMEIPVCVTIYSDVRDVVNLILNRGLMTVAVLDGDDMIGAISVYDAIYLAEATRDEVFV